MRERHRQPPNVRNMGADKRKEWWQTSKRLQADALVCLIYPRGAAIFCIVVGLDKARKKGEGKEQMPKAQERDPAMLWKTDKTASVFLSLVEPNNENVQHILYH